MVPKLFHIPLLVAAAALILAACAAPVTTPAPATEKPTAIQAPTQAPVTEQPTDTQSPSSTAIPPTAIFESRGNITIMGRGWLADAGLLDDFKNKYPGIQLNELGEVKDVYHLTPSELTRACVVEVQTQQMPELIKSGMLADLTDKVAPYTDQLYPSMLNVNQKDGKIYAMPGFFGPLVFYYRRDVMKEAGLSDQPEDVEAAAATWDSFFEMCKTIKDKTGRSCLGNDAYSLYQMVLWQQGLGYTDQDGKLTVDSPQNIATLEELGKFWKSGYIIHGPDENVFDKNPPITGFLGGSGVSGWMKRSNTSGLWGVARMPAMAAGQARASIEPWGISLAIPEACDQKEAAWTFIQFMYGRQDSALRSMDVALWTPGLKIDVNDPQVTAPDAFFGGQAVNSVYLDVASNVPDATIYGPDYSLIVDVLRPAVQKFVDGKISAADALKAAADQIRMQLGSAPSRVAAAETVSATSAAQGQIVFAARPTKDALPQIFIEQADGSNLRQLLKSEYDDHNPALSPDGKRFVFMRRDNTASPARSAIFTMATDSSDLQQVTAWGLNANQPAWSPDGALIAFQSPDEDVQGGDIQNIYTIHPDGTGLTQLTQYTFADRGNFGNQGTFGPAWSPDGSQIVFGHWPSYYGANLFVMNRDGSGLYLLAKTIPEESNPDWGPNPAP